MEGQNLSGQLSDWSIDDLLQIMQVTKKTGSLDIEGERRGRIHFVDGAVTGAELSGERGSYAGSDRSSIADILYVLSTLDSGTFGVGPADGPDGVGLAVEDVLGEVSALRSLEGEVIDAGLFEAPGVKLVGQIDEPITMEPDDWQVLVSLVQPFTFDFLESRVGRGGAVRIFHTLYRLGVAEAATGDDEAEWLDQLAGGLTRPLADRAWFEGEQAEEPSVPKHAAPDEQIPAVAAEAGIAAEEHGGSGAARPSDAEPPADDDQESGVPDWLERDEESDEEEAPEPLVEAARVAVRGVSADASTTLTDGVYDEIRRLRSKASDK